MSEKAQVLFAAAHGPAFSGKDTLCKMLRYMADHCYVTEARFAEPIYEMIRALVPGANSNMSKEEKERPRPELGGLSIRQAAISIGEGFRQYDKECWIKLWRHSLLTEVAEAVVEGRRKIVVLVPDLRKVDELVAFHQLPADLALLLSRRLDEERVLKTWPTLQSDTVVFQIYAQNAPVNDQVNAATETRLAADHGHLLIHNDHAKGQGYLFEQIWASLQVKVGDRRDELFTDLFKRVDP